MVYETRVDRELLLEFFLIFSRFEYALKARRFFRRPNQQRNNSIQHPEALPDWDTFAVSLRELFQIHRSAPIRQACEYILDFPPMKQVIIDDAVAWETPVRPDGQSDIEFLLRMVRCVRNNLFHGGKHNIEVHEDTERTEKILRSSLIILEECLTLSPVVKQAFDEAVI